MKEELACENCYGSRPGETVNLPSTLFFLSSHKTSLYLSPSHPKKTNPDMRPSLICITAQGRRRGLRIFERTWAEKKNNWTPSATSSHDCDLCDVEPEFESFTLFENDEHKSETSTHLLGACIYIAGYLCHQFPTLERETDYFVGNEEGFQFLQILNRGGLKYPGSSVVAFVVHCHEYFENLPIEMKRCRNFLIKCFETIDDIFDTQVSDPTVYRCLGNIFLNNFCKATNSNDGLASARRIKKLT